MRYILGLALSLLSIISYAQTNPVSVASELQRLLKTNELPKYRDQSVVKQISSYDRTGGNDDGFDGTYSSIREEADGSLVVFEAEGKGVIERIWTPTPTDDTLDFYFDGNSEPSFSIRYRDLFSGEVYPFVSPLSGSIVGGNYTYLPIPFENGVKIVFRGEKILFHQFQYRELSDDVNVKTFDINFQPKENELLNDLATLWNAADAGVADFYAELRDNIEKVEVSKTLKPGQSLTLAEFGEGGRVLGIELDHAGQFEGLSKQLDIKITWDGESQPAVYAPLADYFGYAFGDISMKSLLQGVKENTVFSYFPMPYDRHAKIELVYRKLSGEKQTPLEIDARVYHHDQARDPRVEGKFYAYWKYESPALGEPYVLLEGKGKGHYVGTVLHSQATSFTHFTEFFEGDDQTFIDGEMTVHGTGSEDYFNGGWYAQPNGWVEKKGTHLHGCLDYSLPFSRTGGYRLFVSDKMPFDESIQHQIEHGPVDNNRAVAYSSVALYYAEKPVLVNERPQNIETQVLIPDTLTFYSRLMKHLTYDKNMALAHDDATFHGGEEGVMNIDLREIPAGNYQVLVHSTSVVPEGLSVSIGNQSPAALSQSAVNTGTADVSIGNLKVSEGMDSTVVSFTSAGDKFTFNRVMLVSAE
ncbi:glycoside hydrolase family 172 protein [Albibacterium profundi]|uniref:Glycoside hydrolase family 172 protein n=1 Tax=Albibacterium profundi TaxID=3134906 RepID=A0ABV5CBI1_9SPHI